MLPSHRYLAAPDKRHDFEDVAIAEGAGFVLGAGDEFAIALDGAELGFAAEFGQQGGEGRAFWNGARFVVDGDRHLLILLFLNRQDAKDAKKCTLRVNELSLASLEKVSL